MSAASRRATSLWSGTQIRLPRPEAYVAAAACARSVGQESPGIEDHTARGDPPSASRRAKAAPPSYPDQAASAAPVSGLAAGAGTESCFSVVACRLGTASRSTSERVPA